MGALFTVSYWITIVTVIPGLITVASVYGAVSFVDPELQSRLNLQIGSTSELVILAVFILVMVFTQMAGIILEEVLIRKQRLGSIQIEPYSIKPYEEYGELYILLARMKEKDDAQGHLRRAVVQFFMTINTMVAIIFGIIVTLILLLLMASGLSFEAVTTSTLIGASVYSVFLIILLMIAYKVARIRFREMARSLWAAKNVGYVDDAEIE